MFVDVSFLPMSSVREYSVVDHEAGRRRAYATATVANMAGVTPKTVVTWVSDAGASPSAPLRGWAPKTEVNPSGRWLVDADMADEAWGSGALTRTQTFEDETLIAERERLSEERSLFELERRVFEESRITQLENENALLRTANSKLSSQVSRLGGLIRDLTADTHT